MLRRIHSYMNIMRTFIALFALFHSIITWGGCSSETLIATPQQYRIAQYLHKQDILLCRTRDGITVARPIDMIRKRYVNEVIHIVFRDDELDVVVDQQFLLADSSEYITADRLTTDHKLMNIQGEPVIIDRIERRYGARTLLTFSINEHHTFFVTKQGIVVHNNLALTLVSTFENPVTQIALTGISITTIPVSASIAGAVIACGLIYHAKNHIVRACYAIGRGFSWLFGMIKSIGDEAKELLKKRVNAKPHVACEIDQMADPEPNDDGTYLLYEPSPKHYPTPVKNASPGPGWIEGQIALNLSWPVVTDPGKSKTRVAYCRRKIVVFELTGRFGKFMIYHGYYQDKDKINELRTSIMDALKEHNIINHKGKIIK